MIVLLRILSASVLAMHCDDAMCATANEALLARSCDVEAQRLCGGDSSNVAMLGGVSSPATAVAVSGGFSDSVSGRGDGQMDGSSRQEDSLQAREAREAAKAAQLVGANPASTEQNSNSQSDVRVEADSSCGTVSGGGRQSDGAVGDGSCGRVWGYRGQRVGEAAHPGPESAVEVQELREGLAAMKLQLSAQGRQWYLHQPGCRCMLCMSQQEMQQLKQQVRTLTLALAMKQYGNQGLRQQQQQQQYPQSNSKGRRARADKDGRWHRLPRPKVTIRMKVATILAEKAAEVEQAAVAEAQARMQAEMDATATQESVMTETAAANRANASAAGGSAADAAVPDAQVRSWAQVATVESAGSSAEAAEAAGAGAAAEAAADAETANPEAQSAAEGEVWQDCQEMPAEEQLQQTVQLHQIQQQQQRVQADPQRRQQVKLPRPRLSRDQQKQHRQHRRQHRAAATQMQQQREVQRAEREQLRVKQQQERQQRQEQQRARERRIDNRVNLMMEMVFDFRKWIKEEKLTRRKQLKKESAKRVQQLGRMQEQMEKLELSLKREASDSWTNSQNLVANVENAVSTDSDSSYARIRARQGIQLSALQHASDSSDPADASDSSSDSDWEWNALVQGLPREQRCSSCNGYGVLTDFRGLKHGGVKLFKTCNGCREQKRRSGRDELVFKSR